MHDMLAKMLSVVNIPIESIDSFEGGWNKGLTWTEEQQLDYIRWAISYCKRTLRINRSVAANFVGQFLANYGFEVIKNTEENERS